MSFAAKLTAWQREHGRRDLPWQGTRDPYRIWLSEVMLQQTQVSAVIPYYERFLRRFPTVAALAAASEDQVLRLWSGLGYYARGRNLHAAAKAVVAQAGFPETSKQLEELPGVGRSTAAAIAVFAYGERAAILDGNVKRVLARYFGIDGWPLDERLWPLAERLLPRQSIETYTQALMDLGATACTRNAPRCGACPVADGCEARKTGRTAQIPAPRPRKALPEKSVTWLLLRSRGRVLMEKRPAPGLWGGLWTFPEAPGRDVRGYCRRSFGCEIASRTPLAPLEHGFTHFRLRIRPLLCQVAQKPFLSAPGRQWFAVDEAAAAAVPAPVRKLVLSLAN
jgi:A/G-specific adenine glycosylase